MANKFDKPYYNSKPIDSKKVGELFSIIDNMNTDEILQFNLKYNVPLSVTDNNGNNLIHRVLLDSNSFNNEIKRLNMIRFLVENRVNPDLPNKDNMTPLHLACVEQFEEVILFLIKLGVNINYQDNSGNSALHYLLSGKIKEYVNTEKKPLIKKPKKNVEKKQKLFLQLKKEIWEKIRNNDFIESLTKTLENSIKEDESTKQFTLEYGQKLNEFKTGKFNPKDDDLYVQEIQKTYIAKFKDQVEGLWQKVNFDDDDIKTHLRETNSWPKLNEIIQFDGDNYVINNDQGVIKNANYVNILKEDTNEYILNLINILPKNKNINVSDQNTELFNILSIAEGIGNNAIGGTNPINDGILNYQIGLINGATGPAPGIDKAKYNNYLSKSNKVPLNENAIDAQSNIINWEKYYFIGGSRQLSIENELVIAPAVAEDNLSLLCSNPPPNSDLYNKIFSILDYRNIPINYNTNYKNINYIVNHTLAGPGNLNECLLQYLTSLIVYLINNDQLDTFNNDEKNFLSDFNNYVEAPPLPINPDKYYNLKKIIEGRKSFEKKYICSFIYTVYSEYFCCQDNTHLICDINQRVLYLISALNNYNQDGDNFELSLSQASRLNLITKIINRPNLFGVNRQDDVMKIWIYLLFTKKNNNIDELFVGNDLDDDKLFNINRETKLNNLCNMVKDYLNDDNKNLDLGGNDNYRDLLPDNVFTNIKKYSSCEIVVSAIKKYYNEMTQKPLLQHVVDTISILRYYFIDTNGDINNQKNRLINKLKTLYLEPIQFIGANLNIDNIDDFNNDMLGVLGRSNIQFSYLFDYNVGANPPNNFENTFNALFPADSENIAKQLEHLTEFQIPSKVNFYLERDDTYFVNTLDNNYYYLKQVEANHLGLSFLGNLSKINLDLNLRGDEYHLNHYVVNNGLGLAGHIHRCYNVSGNDYLYRPAYEYNYQIFINQFMNKIINMENFVLKFIKDYFQKFKEEGTVNEYGKVIVNYLPILSAIDNHKKFFFEFLDRNDQRTHNNLNEDYINNLKTIINRINSNIYLYYYLKNDVGLNLKIPTFLYHQLSNKNINTIYVNNENIYIPPSGIIRNFTTNQFENNDPSNLGELKTNNPASSYENVLKNSFFVKRIIQESYRQEKKSRVPPSLITSLDRFFEYNIKLMLTRSYKIILKVIDDNDEYENLYIKSGVDQIDNINKLELGLFTASKIIKNYFDNKVYEIAVSILNSTALTRNLEYYELEDTQRLMDDADFEVDMENNTPDDFKDYLTKNKIDRQKDRNLMDYIEFSFSKKLENEFILYSNNYNRLDPVRSMMKIDIKENLLKQILDHTSIDIRLKNSNNQIAFTNLFKTFNYKILKNIINSDNKIYFKSKYEKYLNDRLEEQKKLYLGEKMGVKQLEFFTSTQYKEIEKILQKTFENNILNNLKESFMACVYFIQKIYTKNNFIKSETDKFNNGKLKYLFNLKNGVLTDSEINNLYLNDIILSNTFNFVEKDITYCEEYFIKKFTEESKAKENTYDILVFLTKNTICVGIENLVRKILYSQIAKDTEYPPSVISNNQKIRFVQDKINFILGIKIDDKILNKPGEQPSSAPRDFNKKKSIEHNLYDIMPELFVKYSTKIFKDEYDKLEFEEFFNDDIETVLNNFFDLMEGLSPVKLNKNSKKIYLEYVVPYFNAIISKTINNWRVCIENVFLYTINLHRLEETRKLL